VVSPYSHPPVLPQRWSRCSLGLLISEKDLKKATSRSQSCPHYNQPPSPKEKVKRKEVRNTHFAEGTLKNPRKRRHPAKANLNLSQEEDYEE
jgi:hypothetical protein